MAITNQERVGKALDLLRTEFAPFVAREQPASMKPRSSERGMGLGTYSKSAFSLQMLQ